MATKMPELNWQHEPLAESSKAFKARMVLFLEDQDVTDPANQATKMCIAIGEEGLLRVLASSLTTAEQKIPDKLWTMLEESADASTKVNFRVLTHAAAKKRIHQRLHITTAWKSITLSIHSRRLQ